jgi:hypothetical protein
MSISGKKHCHSSGSRNQKPTVIPAEAGTKTHCHSGESRNQNPLSFQRKLELHSVASERLQRIPGNKLRSTRDTRAPAWVIEP